MKQICFFLFAFSIVVSSCKDDAPAISYKDQLKKDVAEIDAFLDKNSVDAIKDTSGLRFRINKMGTGAMIGDSAKANVYIQVTGKYFDGTVYNYDTLGKLYTLDQLLYGQQIALKMMKKGTSVTLYVPSGLAFGIYGSYDGAVPPNTNVIMELTLLDDDAQLIKEDAIIDDYLDTHGDSLLYVKDPSGLRYIIPKKGTGITPSNTSTVYVNYTGKFLFYKNGAQFGSGTGSSFKLNDNIIEGWKIGLKKINGGGSIILYIPSKLAYGFAGSSDGTIPRNTPVVFNIDLTFVN